jgi:ribosomal protein L7Ae-like RNA K-turn-binding protein
MVDEQKILTLLGFANKAGKLAIGKSAVISNIKKKKVYLVIMSNDASDKLTNEIGQIHTAQLQDTTKDKLGKILGRNEVAIVGLCDQQFYKSMKWYLD